jgi:hypothetical protein
VGDDARLARAGAGEDEQGALPVKDGFALFGVEAVEEGSGSSHRGIISQTADGRRRSAIWRYSTVTDFARFRG